jgi:hypothetical protein
MPLFDAEGHRLYLSEEERRAFVLAAAKASREVRTFCGVLHATGCRIFEGEIFHTLREAQVVIESWRRHYCHASQHPSGYVVESGSVF